MTETEEKKLIPKENNIEKMRLFITITNHGHGEKVMRLMRKYEVALNFSIYGRGTGTQEIYSLLGLSDTRKDIIFSLVKNIHLSSLKEDINNLYSQKKEAKGIAFSVDITSVIGTSIYKYLTNTRTLGEKNEKI